MHVWSCFIFKKKTYSSTLSIPHLALSLLLKVIVASLHIYQPLECDVYESRPGSVTRYALKDNWLHPGRLISQSPRVESSKGYLFQDTTLIIENRTQRPTVVAHPRRSAFILNESVTTYEKRHVMYNSVSSLPYVRPVETELLWQKAKVVLCCEPNHWYTVFTLEKPRSRSYQTPRSK